MLATLETGILKECHCTILRISKAKALLKRRSRFNAGKGFSLVEILSTCPTNWGLNPVESMKRIEKEMIPHYPLGVFVGADLEV